MGSMGTPISPVVIVHRLVHRDAAVEGMTVNEFAPTSPAAAEIREHWAWLQGTLGFSQMTGPGVKELAYA